MNISSNRTKVSLAVGMVLAAALGFWLGPSIYHRAFADGLPELLSLAPSDSTTIFYADLAALRGTPIMQKLVSSVPPANVDRDYSEFVSATGFDFQRDLDRVVLAIRPATQKTQQQDVVFAQGRFDRQKIGQYALRTGKVEKHNGRDVYILPSTTAGKSIYMTFLEGNRLALSDGGDLSPVLDAMTGKPASADPAMQERLSRISGSPVFAVAQTPAAPANSSAAASNPMNAFQALRWVSIAARPDGDQVIVSAEGECNSPNDAVKVSATLQFLRTLAGAGLAEPQAKQKLSADQLALAGHVLDSVQISNDANRVRLLLTLTPEMMNAATARAPALAAH